MESNTRFNTYVKVPPEEEIVISGIAGRFPESKNMQIFQENLMNKVDLGSDDERRWKSVYFNTPNRLGKVSNLDKFDAEYFDMSFWEANCTDCMSRVLLEHTYEAIIDAGINPKELRGSKTGVFIGTCFSDAASLSIYSQIQVSGLPIVAYSRAWQANKISQCFDFKGPSHAIDTACSSSHYALEEAYKKLINGECDAAIVGCSNLCLHPYSTLQFHKIGVLAPDGYCRPFDVNGTGYMRSEALVVVLLQKAKDARRVYANVVYAKTNCDGFKVEGIMHPSVKMQKQLLEEFYDDCGVEPNEVAYMEAHSTGTIVGDPVEVHAIDQVLCSKRTAPLPMGSVKSNMGHAEPSSALCSIAKVLIAMETGVIPPNIHYTVPKKDLLAIIEGRIKIITEPTLWDGGYVGINSFGFGGANCHVLLKSNPKVKANSGISDGLPRLVAVSGRTEEAVKTILHDMNNRQLDVEYIALLHRLHAENMERHPYRGYTIVDYQTTANVINKIEDCSSVKKPICFVFSATEVPCNNDLMQLPVFANAIEKCNTILKQYDICIGDMSKNKRKTTWNNTVKSFLETIATQIGIVDLLTHIGIMPDYTIGYSIGDLISEYVDGRFTLKEIIMTAYYVGVTFEWAKLQIDDIRDKNCDSVKSELLKHFSRNLPQQSSNGRGVIKLGKSRLKWDKMSVAVAEYYVDNILYPMSFTKLKSFLPKNTVFVNILLHNAFAPSAANPLESTMRLVSLSKHDQQSALQSFLQGIGDLYNIGFQPQISNLYPSVQFPVSRGTPMLSPLVKWDHSDNFYTYHHTIPVKLFSRVRDFTVSTYSMKYDYIAGHIIDKKVLFPATAYLYEVWEMISLLHGVNHISTPIVFENVKFIRAVQVTANGVKLTINIQDASNYFEISEGNNVVVRGNVRMPQNIENEKLPVQYLPKFDDTEQSWSPRDIYNELRIRGYYYKDSFQLLKSASINARVGCIKKTIYWSAFMDNMLQMKLLTYDSRSLYLPTQIDKLVINPVSHMNEMQKLQTKEDGLPVYIYDYSDAIVSGGIEIYGLKANAISRTTDRTEAVHEDYGFTAHRDRAIMSLKQVVQMSVHIALECYMVTNVKVIEYIQDTEQILQEDLITLIVDEIVKNLPLVHSNLTLAATGDIPDSGFLPPNISIAQFNSLPKGNKYLIAIGVGILTKGICQETDKLLSHIEAGGFLLTRENLTDKYDSTFLQHYKLDVILEKCTELETLILLKRKENERKTVNIVEISNSKLSWIDQLKSAMETDENKSNDEKEVILVAQGDSECGILGLVNCLRKEPNGNMIRCVFIQDKDAPEFSLENPFYASQLQLNLPINVLRAGKAWGSYRHFSLPSLEPRPVQGAHVIQRTRGDLRTLHWVEKPITLNESLHYNVYAALNFKDIMVASGKLDVEAITQIKRRVDSLLGFEFAGYNEYGRRIMGICNDRAISNIILDDQLSWIVPENWTLEEAATIPCVYTTCYYALYVKGKIKKGEKVLIHSGTGGIGQAAINLALHEGCEVFTTVGTNEKRRFLKNTFPSIPDNRIGNSRDTSFLQMVMQETHGRGVDIVLNSLAEEKLQASVRCLARGGRFLEIGKYDLFANNTLDKSVFKKGISFYGIMLDRVLCNIKLKKKLGDLLHNYVLQGMKSGVVKPLSRKVFDKNDVEAAFRYMTAGKHIGKVLIKIGDEEKGLDQPILALPRYFCEAHKSYVILGGLGGFGLELVDWLILRGARKLLLISRTGVRNGYQRSRIELWKSYGVEIQIIVGADASDHVDCAFILRSALQLGPVDAIFNLAVVLRDSLFENQTVETFKESLKPKAMTTEMLDQLSRKMCPDLRHFVVFSSISCGRGNAGQTNYGMANSVMERICEKRVQDGLPGMAIQWGAIGDVGLVADMQEDNKKLVIGGTLQQSIRSCLELLDAFLVQNRPIVGSMVVAQKRERHRGMMNVVETVAFLMGLQNIKMIGHDIRLSELGLDSMVVVEIQQTFERDFDIHLTTQQLRNITFAELFKLENKDKDQIKEIKASLTSISSFIRLMNSLDIVPDICLEMSPKQEDDKKQIFLLPGIEGCGSIFNTLASKIKGPVTCLQHGVNNISTCESVVQSATTLLPHILMRMKDSVEVVIVGYSFGSLIAIELVRLLESMNLKGRLILIDGTPDIIKTLKETIFPFTTIQEFQNIILIKLQKIIYSTDVESTSEILLKLSKCSTWEEKLDICVNNISKEYVISLEDSKILLTTVYQHLVAVHEYDELLSQPLKSPILLLTPKYSTVPSVEKYYGLNKVTTGNVEIVHVEGDHITILENDEVANAINGNIMLEDNLMEME